MIINGSRNVLAADGRSSKLLSRHALSQDNVSTKWKSKKKQNENNNSILYQEVQMYAEWVSQLIRQGGIVISRNIFTCVLLTGIVWLQSGSAIGLQAATISKMNTYGPFEIGGDKTKSVSVETTEKSFSKETGSGQMSIVIKGMNNKPIYSWDLPIRNVEDDVSVKPEQVPLPDGQKVLLIMTEWEPSAPISGVHGRFFAFNADDKFVPISGLISPSVNDMSPKNFPVVKISGQDKEYFVACDEWTGNFMVVDYYPLNLQGVQSEKLEPLLSLEEYPVKIDSQHAKVVRAQNYVGPNPTVSLYSQVGEGKNQMRQMTIKNETVIAFLGAKRSGPSCRSNCWWLHLRIDGIEGFMKRDDDGSHDLTAIGLPDAG